MRTLSARILLGFAALTITFGVITATLVVNMSLVEDQVVLIGKGYLPLALEAKDLSRSQDDLWSELEVLKPETVLDTRRSRIKKLRRDRDRNIENTRKILDELDKLIEVDPKQFLQTKPKIEAIERALAPLEPLYATVLAGDVDLAPDAAKAHEEARVDALTRLQSEERKLNSQAADLSSALKRRVTTTTSGLEENEHALRLRTIYFGITAVALGLLVTIWVVITLRPLRKLREGAHRIAGGDYTSRIEERGPSEITQLAREFNSMGRAVEERERELVRSERLAAIGKMAAMIAHEVRNPLSSIGLNTELLEDELDDAPEAAEARDLCHSIHREVDRLTQITEEYLTFARLPKPKLAHEPINSMVGALAAFVREDLAVKQVTLTTDLAAGDPIARIDAAQIRQCLLNLIRNASEAVVAKGSGHVTLRTRAAGGRIEIDVEDNGTGIAPEVLPQLFDPFFSTKEDGSGLGLALTQQIVRDHGGDLRVDSTVGRGTTFTVSVPVGAG
jgi:two-component system, NtrC family, sensor kinase